MASHVDLLTELQLLEKVPTLERLRAAQKRRAQQLKKWAQYEQDLQHRKRKHERKRSAGGRRKKVAFEASVALLEASLRNDAEEGRPLCSRAARPSPRVPPARPRGGRGGGGGVLAPGVCGAEEGGALGRAVSRVLPGSPRVGRTRHVLGWQGHVPRPGSELIFDFLLEIRIPAFG